MKFGKSRSAQYYATHEAARKRKQEYDAKFNKKKDQVKKRVALNKYNRKATKAGLNHKGDHMDASHKGSRIVGYSHQSRNRGDKNNSRGDKAARGGGKRR